jgi:rhamnose transport system permease protein
MLQSTAVSFRLPPRRQSSAVVLAIVSPGYFSIENITDLLLANLPVLVVALGMTLVILTGEIDISVGSTFAICSVVAGLLAKAGWPIPLAAAAAVLTGAAIGSVNGALVAYARIPSIVVTLGVMTALREALRWWTQGAWVQDLPPSFQWLGLTQGAYPAASTTLTALMFAACAWALGQTGGRPRALRRRLECGSGAAGRPPHARDQAGRVALLGALTGWAACSTPCASTRFRATPASAWK